MMGLFSLTVCSVARAKPPIADDTCGPVMHQPGEPPQPAPPRELPRWRHDAGDIEANGLGVYAVGMMGVVDGYELAVAAGADEPGPLAGVPLRLNGEGGLVGGGVRGTIQSAWGIRFGVGLSALYGDGLALSHDGLPDGVSIELGQLAVADVEIFIGKGFDATHFYPYVEAKMGIDFVLAEIDVHTDAFGYMGSSTYFVPSLSIAPRVGAFIPLDGDWFIDVSGQYGFIGLERAGAFVGIGTWDD